MEFESSATAALFFRSVVPMTLGATDSPSRVFHVAPQVVAAFEGGAAGALVRPPVRVRLVRVPPQPCESKPRFKPSQENTGAALGTFAQREPAAALGTRERLPSLVHWRRRLPRLRVRTGLRRDQHVPAGPLDHNVQVGFVLVECRFGLEPGNRKIAGNRPLFRVRTFCGSLGTQTGDRRLEIRGELWQIESNLQIAR